MSEMVKVTGLWVNQNQKGQKYFSGNLGGAKVLIFKNSYKKEGDKQPDYQLYIAPNVKKEEQGNKSSEITVDDFDF